MEIVITRQGNIYTHKIVRGGDNDPAVKINKDRAQAIVAAHPDGKTPDGKPLDWAHTAQYWRWSVEIEEETAV